MIPADKNVTVPVSTKELTRLREQSETLNQIADLFQLGSAARTASTIIMNVENVIRRSHCLSAIEREFFTYVVKDDDGDEIEECQLNWGSNPDEYVKQVRAAIKRWEL